MSGDTCPDRIAAYVQMYGEYVTVLDADGNVVDRGDLTMRMAPGEPTVVDGLRHGDSLFIGGVLRYAAKPPLPYSIFG